MGFSNILKTARTLFGHMVIHPFALICTLWMSGALVALITNESRSIELGFSTIGISHKWSNWLMHSCTQLSFSAYDHLKIKLILALITPPAIVIIFYIKNFNKIRSLECFKAKESVYGGADWATAADIDHAGLRAKHGILLGQDSLGYYIADGFQHSLLFAPTGSGKGVGFVIPNLLFWEHSVIVHDIKLENHQLASGWRSKAGQEIYVWEPSNPDGITHCYNPIDFVSKKPGQMVDDVQKNL